MDPRKEIVAVGGENLSQSLIFRRRNESNKSWRSAKNGASSTYGADSKGESVVIAWSDKTTERERTPRRHKSAKEMPVEGQFNFSGIKDSQHTDNKLRK